MCAHPQRKIHGYELRPIVVLRKRKLSAVLTAWCAAGWLGGLSGVVCHLP